MTNKGEWKGLTFGDLEQLLAEAMCIDEDRRGTFVSRLKQWQKMGFPDIERVGKGARATYSLEHLFQLQTLMRLLEVGLSPERGIKVIKSHWPELRRGFIASFRALAENPGERIYVFFYADALGEIIRTQHERPSLMSLQEGEFMSALLSPKSAKLIRKFAAERQMEPEFMQLDGLLALNASAVLELSFIVRRAIWTAGQSLPHVFENLHHGFLRMEQDHEAWERSLPPTDPETMAKLLENYRTAIKEDQFGELHTQHIAEAIISKMREADRGDQEA